MTPAGIEPATFRFVAQHLNHCATAESLADIAELSNVMFVFVRDVFEHIWTSVHTSRSE